MRPHPAHPAMNPGDKAALRLRLHAGHALLHEEGACLPLRSRYGQCRACADACPSQALSVTVDAVRLSDVCTGCGRCTAACPTQALSLPEISGLPTPQAGPSAIRIECRKVPAELLADQSLVMPCLGALTAGQLLAQAAAGHAVQVIDRGWCKGCESGCSESGPAHPASAALDAATLWLQALAAPPTVSLRHEVLPLTLRPAAIPPVAAVAATVDRRRFFRAALDRSAGRDLLAPTPMGGDGRAAYPADARQPSPERQRQHLALQALAARHDTAVPAEFFPRLHAADYCCDRRLCVALCPTAALTVADDGATAQLQFDPLRCIACGTCERGCPEAALSLEAHGGSDMVQTLATHRRLRCTSCGEAYTAGDGGPADTAAATGLCPTCSKSRRFVQDARRQLFGALN
jgi:ferredoxin